MSNVDDKLKWAKPSFTAQACGMEVNMYAPDEEGDVLFRTNAALATPKSSEDLRLRHATTKR